MADDTVLTGDEGDTTGAGAGEAGVQDKDTQDTQGQPGQGGEPSQEPGGKQDDGTGGTDGTGEPGETDDDESGKSQGAPEAYEDFSVPEGIELRDEDVQAFTETAKELNLTQEQAQRLVDLESERVQEMQQEQQRAWQQQVEQWANDTRADEEIGNDNLEAATGSAKRVLDNFGTPALKEVLEQTGLGNHPELVRVFARLGKVMSEDQLVTGGPEGASGDQSPASRLYPQQTGT